MDATADRPLSSSRPSDRIARPTESVRPVPSGPLSGESEALPDTSADRFARWRPYALAAATGGLLFASFYPLDFGPLGWVALVPLLWLATDDRVRRPYRAALLGGLVWTVPQLQWMRLASPPMYIAWLALASYVAVYLPAFVGLVRVGTRRLDLPLPLVAGVAWTGLELVRAYLFTGFAWYFLGHSQHDFVWLAQIADVGGVYAISLLMASFAGLVVMLGRGATRTQAIAATATWATLLAASLGYGAWRTAATDFPTGPRVALVQGDFTSSLKHEPDKYIDIWNTHRELTGLAVPHEPDLIVWPETMVRFPLFRPDPSLPPSERAAKAPRVEPSAWESDDTDRALRDLAAMTGAELLLGGEVLTVDAGGMRQFNAAYPVDADAGVGPDHYGKLHRVPFGEYLPLGEWLPDSVRDGLPVPNLAKGTQPRAFELAGVRVLPLICFEDSVSRLVRGSIRAVGPVDVLANLTNDGWFHGSAELDQHLVSSKFRAIETRTPLVRAANTGISAIIDGNGRVLEPAMILSPPDADGGQPIVRTMKTNGRYDRQFNGVLIGNVPLDPRSSAYLALGDWLAGTCLLAIVVGLVAARRRATPIGDEPAPAATSD